MQANPQVKDRKTMENIPLKMDLGFFIYTFNKYLLSAYHMSTLL